MTIVWKWLRAFALFSFLVGFGGTASYAAATPFVCDGTPYTVIGNPSLLQRVESDLSLTDLTEFNPNINVNGIAYNILDNYIYAMANSSLGGTGINLRDIVQIGVDGNLTNLGSVGAGFSPATHNGTMDSDGNYYTFSDTMLYTVDIGTNPPVGTALTYTSKGLDTTAAGGASWRSPYDWTFNVTTGKLYGMRNGKFYDANVTSGVVTQITVAGDPLPSNAGGAWSTSKGVLYFYSNQDGSLVSAVIEPNGTATFTTIGPVDPNGQFDATACRPPYVTKDADTNEVIPGGQITYEFKIYNPFTKVINVDFTDSLPSGLTYDLASRTDLTDSDDTNIESAITVTDFNTTDLNINDITLPINGFVEFNVTVNVSPIVTSAAEIQNTAYIHYGVNTSPSDDPDTTNPGDGTAVAINLAPTANDDSAVTDEDIAVVIDVDANDTDPENDLNLSSVTVTGAPTNGSVNVNNTTGDITYTPAADYSGTDMFTYEICDNGLTPQCDEANVTVTINSVNDGAPTAENDTFTVVEDSSNNIFDVDNNDSYGADGEGTTAVTITTTPLHGTATVNDNSTPNDPTDDTIVYTPNANYSGSDLLVYQITDSDGDTNTATVNIIVRGTNDTPVVDTPIADQTNIDADTPSVNVSGNFSDPDGDTLTYTATGLPTGLTISTAGVISGTIDKGASQGGTNGVYSVTVTAKDPSGATVTDTFTWTVTNPAPTASADTGSTPEDTPLVVAANGVLGNDTDPDGDTLSVIGYNVGGNSVTVGNPLVLTEGNLTIAGNGSYVFDPAPDFTGTVPAVSYTISDGNGGTASSTLTITVTSVNDTPELDTPITDQSNADAETPSVDVSGNFSDPDGDTLTYTASNLPDGLTISSAGVISGTINKAASQGGTNGVYSVTVTAKDPSGATVTDTFTWTVTNPAPTATDNTKSTNEDTAVSGNVINNDDGNGVDSDPDGDALSVTQFEVGGSTYTAGQTAELTEGNLTIAGSGAYTFTPTANSTDAMPQITYTLSDGEGGTDIATLDISVNGTSDAPVANPDTGSTPEDTQLVVAANGVLGNDTDLDGDALSVTGYNVGGNSATVGSPLVLTEGNLTIASDGSYTFDPAPDFNGPVPTVTYDIEDINGETGSSTLDITVTAVNDAPVAEDDSQSTSINTPVSIPVLNNDHDIENDSLIITDVNTTGTNGTVTFDANGTVIFTPGTDFIGTTTFTYTISDGNGGTDTAMVTITITDPTDPASNTVTAVADSASTEMDTNIDIPVLINDYDPEGDEFSLTNIVTPPVNGTAIIDDNGTPDDPSDDFVTYEPNTDFIGNDTFEYEITDENGNRDIAIITVIVVDPTADAVPNAVADAAITDQDVPVSIDVLDNDTHPDNDDLNISAFTQPANGVVTLVDDQLVYTPNPGFEGHDTFMYTITDSNGDSASAAVTVTLKRLILTLNAFCENDVPYISYDIQLQGLDTSGQTATLTWTGSDGETEVESGLALNNTHHLWAGAEVDAGGNGTVWPGWDELSDGSWEIIYSDWRRWNPDQSDATVTVTLSVNPESTVTVQYPPETSVCSGNPPQNTLALAPTAVSPDSGLPNATDNLSIPITHYGATVINVLANGDSFGVNGPGTVEIKFTQPVFGTVGLDDGGTPNDPTDDVLIYTPASDLNNLVDKFTYTITDAAGNTSTATVTLNVNCASSQTSDSGDALGTFSIILMMFLTSMLGLYFVRKEEKREV